MANPFSGLENIGQSYLAGVQLAQQRQAREDALAQRQEEARIRERYYQDIISERQAQRDAQLKARFNQAASMFGQDLVLANGEPDYAASALKRDRRLQEEQIAGAEGELGALYGTQAPLSPDIIASPAYQTGKLRGTAKRLSQDKDLTAAMIRARFVPVDGKLPPEVENQIEDLTAPDIFSGTVPVSAAPAGGGQKVSFGGREWYPPTPAPKRAEKGGTVKFTGPSGQEVSVNITPDQANQLLAKQLASPDQEPAPYADIDAAEKELKRLARGKDTEVNVYEDDLGNVKVRKDAWGFTGESKGLSVEEAKKQLEIKRRDRAQTLKEAGVMPGPEAGIQEGTNKVPNRVIPISAIQGLPPLRVR